MWICQKCHQNTLAVILIVSLAGISFLFFFLIQPGYSTIISNNNNGSTTTNNNNTDFSKEVFVVDYANIRIQKFDTDGKFIAKWGSEGSGNGQFLHLHSIDIDSLGNVYVTDMQNFNIQKFTSDGKFITSWGSEGDGNGKFKAPEGIAADL